MIGYSWQKVNANTGLLEAAGELGERMSNVFLIELAQSLIIVDTINYNKNDFMMKERKAFIEKM